MDKIITDEQLAELIASTERAADAYVRGDMDSYLSLTHHGRGFTLLPPYGGPASRHENRHEEITSSPALFRSGEARLEHVEAHAWGDTVILAMIERQHGQLGDLPDQEWSLRVTQVYRRDDSDWQLVHRHADPIVRPIGLEELGSFARGPARHG